MVSGLVRTAVLIDGGFFLKRLPQIRQDIDTSDPNAVVRVVEQLVQSHLNQLSKIYGAPNPRQLLYRIFYYDALPFGDKHICPSVSDP